MKEWVFFLEELSARAMLEGLLPRIVPQSVDVRYIVFEGKNFALQTGWVLHHRN